MNLLKPPTSNRTLRVRFDDREIIAEGVRQHFFADISHRCLSASWPAFIAGAAAVFLAVNAIFAVFYWLGDRPVPNVPGRSLYRLSIFQHRNTVDRLVSWF